MSNAKIHTVLISGAGVAGLTLAYWLRRYGFQPTVVEIATEPQTGGQTVDLRGVGRIVIERMGLMTRARELCVDQLGIAYVDGAGRHLAEMKVDDFGGDGIVSELEILRGDLGALLYDAADDVEYLFGRRITQLHEDPDGVEVTFDDATERRFDLVVGADGPHSGVRRLTFGPEEDFVSPLGGYTAWFTAPDPVGLGGWYAMYNEPGGRVVSLRPDRAAGWAKAGLSFVSAPLDYDRRDVVAQRRLVADHFVGVGWQASALVAAAASADDFYFDAIVQVKMKEWSRGRVVLVGDAGYCPSPLTGMGTSLALAGAYVLAGELARIEGDHELAFSAYDARIRPFAIQGQRLPPGGINGYAPLTVFAIRARTFSTKVMMARPFRGLVKKLFFSRADAIDLPDYQLLTASRG